VAQVVIMLGRELEAADRGMPPPTIGWKISQKQRKRP